MTEAFRSAVQFRNDLCSTLAELIQRYTRPLPDGATVYVNAVPGLYRLAKGLGSSYDSLTGGLIVIPGDGSDNRWVQQDIYGSSPWSGVEAMTALNNISAAGSNVWAALGSNAGSFQLAAGDTAAFGVNATSSLLTYHGVPRFMMLTATASMLAAAVDILSIVISKNDDVPAGSSSPQYLNGEQSASNVAGGRVNISSQRSTFVAPGTTLRLMARSFAGDQTIQFHQFTLSAAAL